MTHTPAPWKALPNGGDDPDPRPLIICAKSRYGDWEMVARVDNYPPDDSDPLDNAHLIAAAPKLLAAAQRALVVLDGVATIRRPGDTLEQLAIAIAEAEGKEP